MKPVSILLLSALALSAQSSSATIQFAGTSVGAILTVNAAGFTPEIQGIESTSQVGTCSGATLTSQITSSSTSIPLTLPSGCAVLPGMGIALGCAANGGSCTSVATVKAAGCSAGSCSVSQGQLGTTPGTYAAGSVVTILIGGDGNQFVCAKILPVLQALAQLGAATSQPAPLPQAASTGVATQNSAIATAVAANNSTIAGAFSCAPAI